jgi:hypothetical protein
MDKGSPILNLIIIDRIHKAAESVNQKKILLIKPFRLFKYTRAPIRRMISPVIVEKIKGSEYEKENIVIMLSVI